MKTRNGLILLVGLLVLAAGCVMYTPRGETGPVVTAPPEEPGYDAGPYAGDADSDYYGYLEPYGMWVSYNPYGYVWIPRNPGRIWRPYTLGHWVWTDDGWTWMSTERWGWLVYHYGRWGFDVRLGWYWVPGRVWGPAWVAWRWGDVYIGWAPLPPGAEFVRGYGFRRHDFDIPGHYWSFVQGRDFADRQLDRWIMPSDRNVTIINRTTLKVNIHEVNNRIIDDGVDIEHVRRMTGRPVERLALKDARNAGEARVEGRDAVIYRPAIRTREGAKPKTVVDRDQAQREVEARPGAGIERREPQQQQRPQLQREPRETGQRGLPQNDELTRMNRLQRDERAKLDRDQQTEINEIRRKADAEKASVRSPADRQRIDANTKTRLSEAKKRHEVEKAKLAEKQKAEAAAARTRKTGKEPIKQRT